MRQRLRDLPWWFVVALCLTLGLAPFQPEPHVVEKLGMLVDGTLRAPIDVFDLALHGAPWVLLLARAAAALPAEREDDGAARS